MATAKRRSKAPPPPPSAYEQLKAKVVDLTERLRGFEVANAELGKALAATRASEERYKLALERALRTRSPAPNDGANETNGAERGDETDRTSSTRGASGRD